MTWLCLSRQAHQLTRCVILTLQITLCSSTFRANLEKKDLSVPGQELLCPGLSQARTQSSGSFYHLNNRQLITLCSHVPSEPRKEGRTSACLVESPCPEAGPARHWSHSTESTVMRPYRLQAVDFHGQPRSWDLGSQETGQGGVRMPSELVLILPDHPSECFGHPFVPGPTQTQVVTLQLPQTQYVMGEGPYLVPLCTQVIKASSSSPGGFILGQCFSTFSLNCQGCQTAGPTPNFLILWLWGDPENVHV